MPVIIDRWAIRQKSTGDYLPAPKGRGGRGGTLVEPANPTVPGFEPRLFPREAAAKVALAYWLQGKLTVRWSGGGEEHCHLEPVDSRRLDDMEVVKVKVELP